MKILTLIHFLFIGQVCLCAQDIQLTLVAESTKQWTGIAVSGRTRIFVCFPRWSKDHTLSLAEIIKGDLIAFPNDDWNDATINGHEFTCVQSIFADSVGRLWVLDAGYRLEGDSTTGANLYSFDIEGRRLLDHYPIPSALVGAKSYLNDFRLDAEHSLAYITDSRSGGLVILDLQTRLVRRVLTSHPSTLAEIDSIVIEKHVRRHPVHSDGIELDTQRGFVYYSALMGKNLYRIPVDALANPGLDDRSLGLSVERVAEVGAVDGLWRDWKGNIFLSSLEKNAIRCLQLSTGFIETVVSDRSIKWPDSFSQDPEGYIYFTTSQIHLPRDERESYKIFKFKPDKQ